MNKSVILILVISAFLGVSCSDKNSEKRIAALEDRIKELEGKPTGTNTAPEVVTPEAKPLDVKPNGPLPVISFQSTEFNFGTINEGDIVEHTYSFTNTGDAPLVIESAVGSCGCTVPEWSKTPIKVGATGFIKAKFDSNGKQNLQNKTVTVTANTWPKSTVLTFTAMVTPKNSGAGPVK